MSLCQVDGLTHSYGEKALYKNASFQFMKGEHIGIVGPNGAGKSTLMRILTGKIIPDQGRIRWHPEITFGYLDQYAKLDPDLSVDSYLRSAFTHLYQIEDEMTKLYETYADTLDDRLLARASHCQEILERAGFYSIDTCIHTVATGLGIASFGWNKPLKQLSGGQRAKLILTKLLLSAPDVLLLDEPTNFLDQNHVSWLAEYLCQFSGAFLVISHNATFLEQITTHVLNIEFGMIHKYHGNYSSFLKQKTRLHEDYMRRYSAQQKKIIETEAYIRKNKAGVNSKMARGRQKQLNRIERLAPPNSISKPYIYFPNVPNSFGTALTVENLSVGYHSPLLPPLNFTVSWGQKLVITGFNGIGKSTLLKTLVGTIAPLSGRFIFSPQVVSLYYEQDLRWVDKTLTPFMLLSQHYPGLSEKEIRRSLAQCGLSSEYITRPIGTLSGGEQSKVKLSLLSLSKSNFLLLDEPTNHFDEETKSALHDALVTYPGSIILVSHEEQFYLDFIDDIFSIQNLLS